MLLRLLSFRPFLLNLLVVAFTAGGIHAAPYGPNGLETEWTQPDGTKLSLRVFGDEFYARTETVDGHTVVYNPAENAYHYAIISNDGQKLIPSGRRVSGKAPAGLAKNIHLPVEARKVVWENRYRILAPEERANWGKRVQTARQRKGLAAKGPAPQNADGEGAVGGEPGAAASSAAFAPVTGNYVGLTILVQFPDDPATTPAVDPTNFPTTRAKMERYCNEIGYVDDGNTGSVRDYFRGQSLNATDYTQVVTEIVTLPQPRAYYNWSNYPTNTTLRDGGLTGRLVLNDAITILKAQGFDFTGLTRNGSNQVIATNVIFAGATSGVWPDGLWPHRWVLSPTVNVGTAGSPIYIYDYQITNASSAAVPIGTFCHENGHLLLKYPDLYDYGGESEGCGNHCLMGAGNHNNGGKTPGPINGYFKDVSGWSNVVDITTSQFFTSALTSTNNAGYRIRKPGTATEYFLIENRGTGDPWAQYAPDKGILIWHVDEAVNGNDNQQMTASQHYEVSLEQADGLFDLEMNRDRGDAADAFDNSHTLGFSDITLPDAKWWNGTSSGIRLEFQSAAGASMNVQFGMPPNTMTVVSPNGGEQIYLSATQNITWQSNTAGNVKIELFKGGVLNSVLSASEANDGSYSWVVSAGLAPGNDYSIKISSVATPAYTDSSNATFSILNNSITVLSPNGGEQCHLGSPQNITWNSNVPGNVKIELFKGGVLNTVLSANETNDSSYTWAVSFAQPAGNDYTIKVSSVTSPTITDTSNAAFSVVINPLIAALDAPELLWVNGGDLRWFSQTTTTKDGIDAAESGNITHSQSSTMQTTVTGPGNLTFWWKVSSESGWDFLQFFINDVEHASAVKISGTVDWVQKTVAIPAGSQTLKWTYSKDDSVDGGTDNAWVDQVVYTPTSAPEIAVEQPLATDLTDGTASISCGSANLGSSSSPVTFTVKNVGNANLTGLSISKDGTHNADFTVGSLGATTLAPSATTTFTVTFTPGAAGGRTAAIHIASNDANENPFDISLTGVGVGPGTLAVTPPGDLTASGNFGGPFTPSSLQYTLSNPGGTSIDWTAANTENWVTLDSTGGTLAAGASTTVTASINTTNANTLNIGSYSDTVTFTNTSSGTGNTTRGVSLTVNPFPATVNLSNLLQTYDGFIKPVTVTTTPSGLAHSVTYNGSSTVPTNGGTYAVVATITEPNYAGSASGNLVVAYTVTYQGNGNTSGTVPAAQTKFHDANLTLATNSGNLNKTDYSFSEWNTAADGSGTAYPAGGTYSGNAPLTLYAQWVPGANGIWIQTTAGPFNWGDLANWSGGTVAAGADRTANFTPNITAAQAVNLEAARTIGNITFTDSTTASHDLTISGANALTLARTSGTPTINVTNRTLTISSQISGSSGLKKDGAGQLTLSGTNNFTGGTALNAGTLATTADANLGTGGGITVTGTSTWNAGINSTVTYNRSLTVNDGTILTLASGNALKTVTGVLSGNGAITNSATTTFEFNNTGNTFTGAVSNGYEMRFNSLGDSSNAINLIGSNGLFTWQGAAKTFALRPFTLNAAGTGIINNNGTGALTIQQNLAFSGAAGTRTLTLQGTNTGTNTFSGNIANNGASTTALGKSGAGNWALGGTNTYSGATSVGPSGGTLTFLNAGQSVSPNTAINLTITNNQTQTIKLLSDTGGATDNLNLGNTIRSGAGGSSGTGTMAIFVGNNGAANGGNGAGGVSGSTIVLGTLDLRSNSEGGITDARMATKVSVTGANGYKLQFGDVILQARGTGSAIGGFFNPTTAPLTITGTVKQNNGRTAADNAALQILTLDGTSTVNVISGAIKNADDYPTNVNALPLSLTKSNTGEWLLSSSTNTFTGTITFTGTTASGGKLSFASASGTNPITFNATTGFGSTLTYTGATPLTMSGLIQASALTTGGILFEANGTVPTATINYSNASSLSTTSIGTSTRFITFGGSNAGDNTFSGAINNNTGVNGNAQVAKVDAGKWVLTGNGNYTGGIFINNGTVSVNSLPNGGSNSPLGANTRINLGRDNTTATLIYTGGGNTTNRDLRLGGPSTNSGTGGSTILNDGTGALTFTAATFNISQTGILFNRTLTLGGSYTGAANEIQGIIQNNTASTGPVNLDKTGAGAWKLSGANTYSGTTTVSAGTLELGANNVLPNASAVSIGTATLKVSTVTDTAGTLDTTGAAVINLGSGGALAFANSAAVDWTGGTLNISGTFVSGSSIRFGTISGGLTSAQLALISVNGSGAGTYILDADGYLILSGPGPVDHFAISTIGSPQTMGSPINGITLTAQDASNDTAVSFTGSVTFGGTAGITGTSATFTAGVLTGVSVTSSAVGTGLTFTVDDGAGHTGVSTFNVQSIYNAWAIVSGAAGGLGGNTDGDTLTNLQEFAFGTNPGVSTGGSISYMAGGSVINPGLPVAGNLAVGAGVDYRAVFGRRKDYQMSGLAYTVQFSADMTNWVSSSATPTVLTGVDGSGEMEAVSVPYPLFVPVGSGFKKPTFFRVAVTGN